MSCYLHKLSYNFQGGHTRLICQITIGSISSGLSEEVWVLSQFQAPAQSDTCAQQKKSWQKKGVIGKSYSTPANNCIQVKPILIGDQIHSQAKVAKSPRSTNLQVKNTFFNAILNTETSRHLTNLPSKITMVKKLLIGYNITLLNS